MKIPSPFPEDYFLIKERRRRGYCEQDSPKSGLITAAKILNLMASKLPNRRVYGSTEIFANVKSSPDAFNWAMEYLKDVDCAYLRLDSMRTGDLDDLYCLSNLALDEIDARHPKVSREVPANIHGLPAGIMWADILIQFVSKDSISIKVKGQKSRKFTFAEIGFKDQRKGDLPDKNWEFFYHLAKEKGALTKWPMKTNAAVQKRIQTLRNRLKSLFGIDEDPFHPYREAKGYITKFELGDISY